MPMLAKDSIAKSLFIAIVTTVLFFLGNTILKFFTSFDFPVVEVLGSAFLALAALLLIVNDLIALKNGNSLKKTTPKTNQVGADKEDLPQKSTTGDKTNIVTILAYILLLCFAIGALIFFIYKYQNTNEEPKDTEPSYEVIIDSLNKEIRVLTDSIFSLHENYNKIVSEKDKYIQQLIEYCRTPSPPQPSPEPVDCNWAFGEIALKGCDSYQLFIEESDKYIGETQAKGRFKFKPCRYGIDVSSQKKFNVRFVGCSNEFTAEIYTNSKNKQYPNQ